MKNFKFNIIEGVFAPAEALKIIMDMINSKVLFHNVEIFSSNIRFGKPSETSSKRLVALQNISKELNDKIAEAGKLGKRLKVEGVIDISFID